MIISEFLRKVLGLADPHCESCETLKVQLGIANHEKQQLLSTILDFTKPRVEEKFVIREIDPIKPRAVPFSVKRQMLEEEDRAKAEILRKRQEDIKDPTVRQDIEDLEKELGIENG